MNQNIQEKRDFNCELAQMKRNQGHQEEIEEKLDFDLNFDEIDSNGTGLDTLDQFETQEFENLHFKSLNRNRTKEKKISC